tara:strand:- start:439 stop:699 length:261 start_codon:yes stop_codon:yes gene_type:complete
MKAITDPTKKSVRQTARRQMSELKSARKRTKKYVRDYGSDKISYMDDSMDFLIEGDRKDAKKKIRRAFRKKKKLIKDSKKASLNRL